jgi:hypothetical protein
MAAGLGFKTFNTGDVLSAADVNGYLMQGVLVFADATARDAAITSPQEGQFAYTKDNNSLWYYTGSAWAASGATGDIEGVTAGIGISGGGTSGTVTITNSMATAIDAKGDLIVGTGSDTFSRLAAGTNTYVLTADSAETTGLKWAAPASGGGMTSIASGSLSGSSLSLTSISGSYKNLQLILRGFVTGEDYMRLRFNNSSSSIYDVLWLVNNAGSITTSGTSDTTQIYCNYNSLKQNQTGDTFLVVDIYDYANTTTQKNVRLQSSYLRANDTQESLFVYANANVTAAINRIDIVLSTTFSAGTYILYGVN